jgi:NAD+ kinase
VKKTLAILANRDKPEAMGATKRIAAWAERRGYGVIMDRALMSALQVKRAAAKNYAGNPKQSDLIITLGGDGFLLHAATTLYPCSVPILAVNLGSLGFNAQSSAREIPQLVEAFFSGKVKLQVRFLLLASVIRGKRRIFHAAAVNDVAVTKEMKSRIIHVCLRVNGAFVTEYKSDGLIVSTPTGSTAYNLAAGGPILYPDLETIVVAPLCPHSLNERPLVLPAESRLEILYEQRKDREAAALTTDGQRWQALRSGDRVEIVRAGEPLRLVINPTWDYFKTLRHKLHWGSGEAR